MTLYKHAYTIVLRHQGYLLKLHIVMVLKVSVVKQLFDQTLSDFIPFSEVLVFFSSSLMTSARIPNPCNVNILVFFPLSLICFFLS